MKIKDFGTLGGARPVAGFQHSVCHQPCGPGASWGQGRAPQGAVPSFFTGNVVAGALQTLVSVPEYNLFIESNFLHQELPNPSWSAQSVCPRGPVSHPILGIVGSCCSCLALTPFGGSRFQFALVWHTLHLLSHCLSPRRLLSASCCLPCLPS